MKKICSLFLLALLIFSCAIQVSAAGGASLSGAGSVVAGETVELTLYVSNCPDVSSAAVSVSFSDHFELVSGTWLKTGALTNFDANKNKGAIGGLPSPDINGSLFRLVLKAKTPAAGGQTVSITVTAKNGSTDVMSATASKSITITCASHTYGDWSSISDSDHQKTCSACGQASTQPHSWNSGAVTKPATCEEEGVKTFTCTQCGHNKTESIPMIAHTMDSGTVTKPATCKEEGVKTFACTACDHTETEPIPMVPHSFGNLTAVDNTNHKDSCSVCGEIKLLPHSWNGGTVTKPATCEQEGVKTFACSQCDHTRTEPIPVIPHTFGNLVAVNDTNHKESCSGCGKENILPHSWNKGTVTKPATCKEEGVKTFTCTGCGHTKTEKLPITDKHTWSRWNNQDDSSHKRSCSVCGKEETGNHSYHSYWSKNSEKHWHECSVCKNQKDEQKHVPGPEATENTAQTCKVCNYIIKAALTHTHDYAQEWTTDENGHWYACAGCEEKGELAAHSFDNDCDPDCAICGYTREAGHSFGTEWLNDGENHWHACAGCEERESMEAHIPGAQATESTAQTCTICGYELTPALGVPETEPTVIATEPAVTEATVPEEPVEVPDGKSEFPWWIVAVAAVIILGGVCFVALKKKQ